LIADTFGLNGFYVELLNAPAGRSYENLVDGVTACEKTGIVSNGNVCGLVRAVAHCRGLRAGSRFAHAMQGILGTVGCVLTASLALTLNVMLPPLYAIVLMLVSSMISAVAALGFSRP
jgi:hypothetical protein